MGGTWGFKGLLKRALEFPAGDDVAVSPPGRMRMRYNAAGAVAEISTDGGAYVPIGSGGASPWVRVGTNIRPVVVTDTVSIGAANVVGTERLRVVGDIRVDSTVYVSNLSTVGGDLGVSSNSGRVAVTVGGTSATAFDVQDATGPLFSADLSGGGRDVLLGTSALPVDEVQSYSTRTAVTIGQDASAFDLTDGVDSYMLLDTTPAAEELLIGVNSKIPGGMQLTGASNTLTAPNNSANAWQVLDGVLEYFGADTTTGSESVSLGNASTDVGVTIKDNSSQAMTVQEGGSVYLGVDTTNGSESLTLGNTTTNPDIIFDTNGDVSMLSPLCLIEVPADPAPVANTVKLYAKDVAAVSQLFAESDDGTVHQLTPVSGASPGGANTNVQFNNGGAFGGDAGFTYNGAGLVSVSSGLTRTAAGALNIGTTVATSIVFGSTIATATFNVQDNINPAFKIQQGANNIMNVATTNFVEEITWGNSANSWSYAFNGSPNCIMQFGNGGSGRINVTNIGPSTGEVAHGINIGTLTNANLVTIGRATQDTAIVSDATILGGTTPVGAERLLVVGDAIVQGKLTVTGSLDPTDLQLTGGTALFISSTDGSTAPVSAAGSGRIRYNNGTTQWEASVNGGAYAALGGATPAGANTEVQFNNAGAFGASSAFTWDNAGTRLTLGVAGAGELDVTSIRPNPAGGGHAINIATAGLVTTVTIGQATSVTTIAGGLNMGGNSGATIGQVLTGNSGNATVLSDNIDKAAATAGISIGAANATSVFLGRSGQLTRVFGNFQGDATVTANGNLVSNLGFAHNGNGVVDMVMPDNQDNVFRVRQSGLEYINLSTINGSETLDLGTAVGIACTINVGNSSSTIGLYGTSATGQYSTTGTTAGFTANVGAPVLVDSTFTGSTGATAYTIGDVVRALKLIGLMAA